MTTLSLTISDSAHERLKTLSEKLSIPIEQLAQASLEDFARSDNADFEDVKARVIAKNKELYDRLS